MRCRLSTLWFYIANRRSEIDLKIGIKDRDAFATGCCFHYEEAEYNGIVRYFDYISLSENGEVTEGLFEAELS